MNDQDTQAIVVICLAAAFADGGKDDRERAAIRRIVQSLSPGATVNLEALYQDVLLKRVTAEQAAQTLSTADMKQLAFEMAVCVCDADDTRNAREQSFLDSLRETLGLDAKQAEAFSQTAAAVAATPLDSAEAKPVPSAPVSDEADKMILNYAILNGALELLPQSLATMAIIPLQMKMVYRISKAHGFELDRGHIKDFLATLGVGLTSQYVEQFGRKLLGGLLGKAAGGLLGGIGSAATGVAFSFATTYALGHVAKQYYGDGRRIDAAKLKALFGSLVMEGKALQSQYAGDIQNRARNIDMNQIAALVRQ
jgi:uncharacterized protein (DUF697 family)/tellurite resistance protein